MVVKQSVVKQCNKERKNKAEHVLEHTDKPLSVSQRFQQLPQLTKAAAPKEQQQQQQHKIVTYLRSELTILQERVAGADVDQDIIVGGDTRSRPQ
jgi:hypothetical protein